MKCYVTKEKQNIVKVEKGCCLKQTNLYTKLYTTFEKGLANFC